MRDKVIRKRAACPCIARIGWVDSSDLQRSYFRKGRMMKMKSDVALEKILPRTEQCVQNGVFIQRR